jgi:hypothetical protein
VANLITAGIAIVKGQLRIGADYLYPLPVHNGSGGTLAKGTLVYVSGYNASSGYVQVTKADADAGNALATGIVLADIANGKNGFVGRALTLTGQNTNAGNVGDPVYLHTTAGGYTLSAPSASNAAVQVVGRITVKSATVGKIAFDLTGNGLQKIGSNELATGAAAANLSSNLKTGIIPLLAHDARILATNAYLAIASSGGILATDTNPSIARVNGATDPSTRITWASSHSEEIQWDFVWPADVDTTQAATLHLILSMGGATNTPTVTAKQFTGIGGSDQGGATAALNTTPTDRTVSLATPGSLSKGMVSLTPGAHTTDAMRLDGAWISFAKA